MYRFATLTQAQIELIETLEIGRSFISEEHCEIVKDSLGLRGKAEPELRAVRNSVVRHLGDRFEEVRENYEAGSRLLTNMSGITAVIDSMLWDMGAEV